MLRSSFRLTKRISQNNKINILGNVRNITYTEYIFCQVLIIYSIYKIYK